jgi:hypothetical protein
MMSIRLASRPVILGKKWFQFFVDSNGIALLAILPKGPNSAPSTSGRLSSRDSTWSCLESGGHHMQFVYVSISIMPMSAMREWSYKRWENATFTDLTTSCTYLIRYPVTSSFLITCTIKSFGTCTRRWTNWKRRSESLSRSSRSRD